MSDGDLESAARRAARGDAEAFATLCRALQDDIWRYCYALTADRELAFEAAQETFLRAVTAIRRFRGDAPVRVWLLVLARRSVAELRRRDRRQPTPIGASVEPVTGDRSGEVEVNLLVGSLEEARRQAFVLTQMLGLSYEQAARVAGVPVGTIRSRVFRARCELVCLLSDIETPAQEDRHGPP
ncbi:MAG: sigma-70 family RNA polymerase sigma factor [Egibacteraceae bacterium]